VSDGWLTSGFSSKEHRGILPSCRSVLVVVCVAGLGHRTGVSDHFGEMFVT